MAIDGSLFDGNATRDFLSGFFVVAVVVGIFAMGLEVGAATAGDPVEWPLVAAMGFGALASAGGLVHLRTDG